MSARMSKEREHEIRDFYARFMTFPADPENPITVVGETLSELDAVRNELKRAQSVAMKENALADFSHRAFNSLEQKFDQLRAENLQMREALIELAEASRGAVDLIPEENCEGAKANRFEQALLDAEALNLPHASLLARRWEAMETALYWTRKACDRILSGFKMGIDAVAEGPCKSDLEWAKRYCDQLDALEKGE